MHEAGANDVPWDRDTTYAFGLNRLVGRVLGIWSLNCNDLGSRIRLLIVLVFLFTLNVSLLREFGSDCVSEAKAVDYFGIIATSCVSLLKISMISIHQNEMGHILSSALRDWSVVRNEESRKIMLFYARLGRIISIPPLCFAYLTIVPLIFNAPPTIERMFINTSIMRNHTIAEGRNLPMGISCSVIGLTTSLYLLSYAFQTFQHLCLCTCNLGCDAILHAISMHLCAQFELLKIEFASLDQRFNDRNIGKEIVILIRRHDHLLHHLNLVEDIFHIVLLGALAASGSEITVLGIQVLIAMQRRAWTALLYAPIGMATLLIQLLAYSFTGDYLSTHAEEVRNAAYSCNWYNFPARLAKNIMFVITRSSAPFHLTAGRIFRFNIESFTTIVKTMASFFSVMKLTIVK